VLDCSVAAKWILPEPGRESALELLARYEAGEVSLIAPELLLAEFASLLAKRRRRKQLSAAQARQAFQLLARCSVRLFDVQSRLVHALDLALERNLSLWDCVYLALAIEHGCPLLTADRRLLRSGLHSLVRLVG